MSSVNSCTFIGNVGRIDSNYMKDGKMVTKVSLACTEGNRGKERTEWINIVFFEKTAEIAAKYASKGRQIYVSGKMQTRKWTDKNGVERYTTEIIGRDIQLLGPKTDRQESGNSSFDDEDIPF